MTKPPSPSDVIYVRDPYEDQFHSGQQFYPASAPEQPPRQGHYVEPFAGYAYPGGSHPHPHQQISYPPGLQYYDGGVSPRTLVADPIHPRRPSSPRPRVVELEDGEEEGEIYEPLVNSQQFREHGYSIAATPGLHGPAVSYANWVSAPPAGDFKNQVPPQQSCGNYMVPPGPALANNGAHSQDNNAFYAPPPAPPPTLAPQAPGVEPHWDDPNDGKQKSRAIRVPSDDDNSSTTYPRNSVSTSNATEDEYSVHIEAAIRTVHDACLQATQRHMRDLRANWQIRRANPYHSKPKAGPFRRSPYSDPGPRRGHHFNTRDFGIFGWDGRSDISRGSHHLPNNAQNPLPHPTDSLLQNTTHIADIIWCRALRDRLDVLDAEGSAVRSMDSLRGWAETVTMFRPDEWERDGGAEAGMHRVVDAGKNLCHFLGDIGGVRRLEEMEMELHDFWPEGF